ncbi:metalloregulator ArsR/SmtB family transcription factor [Pseudanabaena sp. FACHB-2040]|uniref:helix-turn-helix transcriptional regulator n=1 Tax=Pseudanabaena sp. FACHB-2040 TaxID=2692859 RepID=UPI0016879052|nr:metalloregulator ArsR/SmtB family transcription factor [Pseudanabaena sp. FACHB-2040]MBD2259753.1 transcriptional regulator [Pseudanabaena sp. FACHB-2040]
MTTPSQKSPHNRTRQAILHCLKQAGPTDSQELAAGLGISAMAVRQHLYALHAEKLVTYQEEPRPMGRPAKLWQLTPNADRFFPNGYADLTLGLIQSVIEAFGPDGLDRLLAVRTHHQLEQYQTQIPRQQALAAKLSALAQVRTEEGYMAEVRSQPDGSYLLVENHCPICVAAAACTGLCDRELEIFQQVLGNEVTVKRTEHIVAGARRCAYRVCQQDCSDE